jgi:hypothetical protein
LTQDNIRSFNIRRFGIKQYDDSKRTVGGLSTQLNLAEDVSIHKQVLEFLTSGTQYKWDVENHLVTVETLLEHNVIRPVHEDINTLVLPKEIYPEYEYVQLSPDNIKTLKDEYKRFINEDEYVTQALLGQCKCSGVHKEVVDNNVDINK